ncbi:hypothetical protein [Streptomyces sp. R41]|uniref:Uncharacterized protein n=1 Tax=Streptomyces sp. R41 TaxID=3238632 RepID=A0AB39RFB9_9ACTN
MAAVVGLLGAVLSTPAGAEARDIGRDTLAADDGRTPTPHGSTDSARQADRDVARGAGAGRAR